MIRVAVQKGDPRTPGVTRLLQDSHALMQSLFPAENNHYLSIENLCRDDILFYVAVENQTTLGCGALALKDGYGEVKSMFVAPDARGKGVATNLLKTLIQSGRDRALPVLRLETGNSLTAAHRLYEQHGFTYRGPFGDYSDDPISLFMEKTL